MNRLDLYKARYAKWRATNGTESYYRATAQIRAYHGDPLGAALNDLLATISHLAEQFAEAAKAIDLNAFRTATQNLGGVDGS